MNRRPREAIAEPDWMTRLFSPVSGTELTLRRAKSGALVTVYLPPVVVRAMASLRGSNPDYLWWTGRGKPVTTAKYWRACLRIVAGRAGAEGFRPHRLRDTFAVFLLGHSSIQTTERRHARRDRRRRDRLARVVRAANRLDPLLAEIDPLSGGGGDAAERARRPDAKDQGTGKTSLWPSGFSEEMTPIDVWACASSPATPAAALSLSSPQARARSTLRCCTGTTSGSYGAASRTGWSSPTATPSRSYSSSPTPTRAPRPARQPCRRKGEGYIGASGRTENRLDEWTVFGPESTYEIRAVDDEGNWLQHWRQAVTMPRTAVAAALIATDHSVAPPVVRAQAAAALLQDPSASEARADAGPGSRPARALSGEQAVDLQRQVNEPRGNLLDGSEERLGGHVLGIAIGIGGIRAYRRFRVVTALRGIGGAASPGTAEVAEDRRVRDMVAATGRREISFHSHLARIHAEQRLSLQTESA